MKFLEQANKSEAGVGTFVLTIALVLFSIVIGSAVAEMLSIKILGFSLQHLPDSADKNAVLSLLLLPFVFLLATLVLCIKYLHKRAILSLFTARAAFDWKRFFVGFGVWGLIMGIYLLISIANGAAIEWNYNSSTFIGLLLVSLFILPIQTSAEDALFRGFLFQGFGKFFKKGWISILITGVLFGLLHWANPEVAKIGDILLVFYIGTGVFLGIIAQMDDGLELSMGYHAVNNIFASLIVTNNWQAFTTDALLVDKTPPTFGWEPILTILVLQPFLLFLFSKIYKWKNWKEKLLN
jgi:membrane protease YdiL (CAAX protease family)